MAAEQRYRGNGKILLSGEYLVLDGATALGIPTTLGQQMSVKESSGSDIMWESFLPDGSTWFSGKFDLFGFDCIKSTDDAIAERLTHILESSVRLNSDFLSKWKKYKVKTHLEFAPEWGLGTSSTLISCVAEWADVDPFHLLEKTFGGSGYDIACARAEGPIFYEKNDGDTKIGQAHFMPGFAEQLYLVYLGQKQDTREGIASYENAKVTSQAIDEVSSISRSMCEVNMLHDFSRLMESHEDLVASLLKKQRVQKERFPDYWGTVKSLGAWGGDFALATSDRPPDDTRAYFEGKGCQTVFQYSDLALREQQVA